MECSNHFSGLLVYFKVTQTQMGAVPDTRQQVSRFSQIWSPFGDVTGPRPAMCMKQHEVFNWQSYAVISCPVWFSLVFPFYYFVVLLLASLVVFKKKKRKKDIKIKFSSLTCKVQFVFERVWTVFLRSQKIPRLECKGRLRCAQNLLF